MKKTAVVLLILSLITLGACGSEEPQERKANEETSDAAVTESKNENESLNDKELDEAESSDKEEENLNSDEADRTDEQIEEESGGEFSEDIDNSRDGDEIYLETERVMKEAMQEEGHPTVHLSKREYTNISQPSENTYIVSGKVYTNASELIGSYTLDVSYSDDGGVDYEWKVNYE